MRPNRALICGYYGFANAGDEAMLKAVIDALRGLEPGLELTVLSGNPQETAARHDVLTVHRFAVGAILRAVFRSDVVISGGGSLLQDVTSRRSIFYYLGVMMLAELFGKPVMLYGQGIGPIRAKFARWLTALLCRRAAAVAVRDEQSVAELTGFGVDPERIFLTADPVMGMHPVDREAGRVILRAHGLRQGKPVLGLSVREWPGSVSFKKEFARVADSFIREYDAHAVFLPLQHPGDLIVSHEIAELMEEKANASVLSQRYSIAEVFSLVGNMDVLLGIRLHALIFGVIMQIPVLGVSYDPKIEGFLTSINSEPVAGLKGMTAGAALDKIREIMADKQTLLLRQNARLAGLRNGALENARLAVELLHRSKSKG